MTDELNIFKRGLRILFVLTAVLTYSFPAVSMGSNQISMQNMDRSHCAAMKMSSSEFTDSVSNEGCCDESENCADECATHCISAGLFTLPHHFAGLSYSKASSVAISDYFMNGRAVKVPSPPPISIS
jgi:hypothetical protein